MKPAWLIPLITLPVVTAGLICGIVYHDARMFYAGLVGAVLMLLVFPFAVVFGTLVRQAPLAAVRCFDYLCQCFTRRR